MNALTMADALRLAINVLRVSAESHKMPSGAELDQSLIDLHVDAAEILETSLTALREHE